MAHALDTWREYLVDLVLEDNNYTEILQEYQLGVTESTESYTAYGLGNAILDIEDNAQLDASRSSAIADAETMLKAHLQNNDVQLTNAVINEVQYKLTSENSHIIYVVYTIDKSNVIYPVIKEKPKTNKKKDKQTMAEFELKNEQHAHLKFKKDDADVLYITTKEKNNFVSVDEIKERVNRFKFIHASHAVNQYIEYIDNLIVDVQTELDNKTTKSI
jgi:hypothetical protein